ncbi:hypothetical protein [Leptolyngbya sp. FACHB-711]|uniref:hypothetical protein n=1 Tax=Leptolyngbya sp. FACHB-711 TaxID=2692813 RepID=UPI00168369F5|nr:hypothetical protein [Leptolyngbya sp. FACHB-711]MBD2023231.1 hypothetical protein [Leptolyngbya sp. FACHB-711]
MATLTLALTGLARIERATYRLGGDEQSLHIRGFSLFEKIYTQITPNLKALSLLHTTDRL